MPTQNQIKRAKTLLCVCGHERREHAIPGDTACLAEVGYASDDYVMCCMHPSGCQAFRPRPDADQVLHALR